MIRGNNYIYCKQQLHTPTLGIFLSLLQHVHNTRNLNNIFLIPLVYYSAQKFNNPFSPYYHLGDNMKLLCKGQFVHFEPLMINSRQLDYATPVQSHGTP